MAASQRITTYDDLNISSVSYGDPTVNARGGKNVKILDSNKRLLNISTPMMLTWGANKNIYDDSDRPTYDMSLQIPGGTYASPSTDMFYAKMKEFETKILNDAVSNSKDWFNKPRMSKDVAEALFTPMLRYPKDKVTKEPDYTRSPTLRVKIPFWEGKFNHELFNEDSTVLFNEHTDLSIQPVESYIPKTSRVACIIRCNGLWFANGKFGVTWRLVQAVVRQPVSLKGQCFIKLNTDDMNQLSAMSRREAEAAASAEVADELDTEMSTAVEDSDVSDDEPEPPKPVVKKKKTRRVVKRKTKKTT